MSRFPKAYVVVGAVFLMVAGCGDANTSDTAPSEAFVCGTDGKTYSVEDAARGEHEIQHRGRCDEPMQCGAPDDCFVGDACLRSASEPDLRWCVPGVTQCNCPGVFEPVCGGDGRNYINGCEAACAGVGIRYAGYCNEPPGTGCVRAGCSDQLCVEEGMDIASTCEWRPVYECYQQATCERQPNGQCGFTPTHELVECLERFGEGMCRVDPLWQEGFEAECESPQVPGIVGVISVEPLQTIALGEWFQAGFQLLEPPVFGDVYQGEGLLFCEGGRTLFQGVASMTPLGPLELNCSILPDDCPVETHVRNLDGQCVPKCYGPEQCGDEQRCNASEVCLQDPACPECDVCVGWCVPPAGDCRTNGCEAGWTCDYCQLPGGGAEWICLSPEAGACLPPDECRPTGCNGEICASEDLASPCVALPEFACYREVGVCQLQPWGQCGWTPTPELDECLSQFDCRATGCAEGTYCDYCWTRWECIPEGAVC